MVCFLYQWTVGEKKQEQNLTIMVEKKTPLTCEIENKQIKTKIRLGIKKKETPHTSHKKERKLNIG